MSRRCRVGIVPFVADELQHQSDIEDFDKASRAGNRGSLDVTVTAIFTGQFRFVRAARPDLFDRRELWIDKVGDMRVKRRN